MDEVKRQRLEAAGWKVGTVNDFLELSPEESEIVELKLALSQKLKDIRTSQHLSQIALAKRMNSSQSRIAKIEAGDPSVSLDLLIRGLFSVGATKVEIAQAICGTEETISRKSELMAIGKH